MDHEIVEIVRNARTIAVVGCSPKPDRDSNSVARYLMEQGYLIVPINPGQDEILGVRAYPDLLTARESEGSIDIVDIFRAPELVMEHVDEAIQIEARLVWMQLGVINEEAADRARKAGIPVVMDECLRLKHKSFLRRRLL